MSTKTSRKLVLNVETLKHLEGPALREVSGQWGGSRTIVLGTGGNTSATDCETTPACDEVCASAAHQCAYSTFNPLGSIRLF